METVVESWVLSPASPLVIRTRSQLRFMDRNSNLTWARIEFPLFFSSKSVVPHPLPQGRKVADITAKWKISRLHLARCRHNTAMVWPYHFPVWWHHPPLTNKTSKQTKKGGGHTLVDAFPWSHIPPCFLCSGHILLRGDLVSHVVAQHERAAEGKQVPLRVELTDPWKPVGKQHCEDILYLGNGYVN